MQYLEIHACFNLHFYMDSDPSKSFCNKITRYENNFTERSIQDTERAIQDEKPATFLKIQKKL